VSGCVFCGGSLDGKRPQARFCSSTCRREACRVRALLSGRSDSGYPTLAAWAESVQSAGQERRMGAYGQAGAATRQRPAPWHRRIRPFGATGTLQRAPHAHGGSFGERSTMSTITLDSSVMRELGAVA
jgi:hypothetical protein